MLARMVATSDLKMPKSIRVIVKTSLSIEQEIGLMSITAAGT